MQIYYLPKFERQYKKLPVQIKRLVKEKEQIFRQNPFDSRLKTHKLHGVLDGWWAFRVDYTYRLIFDFIDAEKVRFYSVGDHDIYE